MRAFMLIFTFLASVPAFAQIDPLVLIKHRPIYEYFDAVTVMDRNCTIASLKHRTAMFGAGDLEISRNELIRCVDEARDAPKVKLIAALRYLDGKSGSTKALKEVHLKWLATLDALVPLRDEPRSRFEVRNREAKQALDLSKKSLELEIELGT